MRGLARDPMYDDESPIPARPHAKHCPEHGAYSGDVDECPFHRLARGREQGLQLAADASKPKKESPMIEGKKCAAPDCENPLPEGAHALRRYCSSTCNSRHHMQKKAAGSKPAPAKLRKPAPAAAGGGSAVQQLQVFRAKLAADLAAIDRALEVLAG